MKKTFVKNKNKYRISFQPEFKPYVLKSCWQVSVEILSAPRIEKVIFKGANYKECINYINTLKC